jgi:serine/threonine protein kinase
MQTLEGTQLGNYDVIRRIRAGGMGAVYEGRQRTAFGRQVAIKVILGNFASDRDMRRRFAREARTVAQLRHPHILPLIEFGDERGLLYLVMPFIEGGTLTSYLRRELPDLQDIATIFLQLLDAVEYAHEEGLIHRDIKSSNVLLDARRGGRPYVYLADFGLVRFSHTSPNLELEEMGKPIPLDEVPGTPHYMAPEQTRGIVTRATDIYALGVLLYQLLTGELPYDDPDDVEVVKMHLYAPVPSPCERDASIPAGLGEVTQKAMAKRAEQRYRSVAEMRQAFLAAIEGPAAHITEDDPEIDVMAPDASRPLPPPLPQSPRRRLPPQASPQRSPNARRAQQRRASVPLSRVELPQATAALAPEPVPPRRRVAAPAPRAARALPARSSRRRRGRFVLVVSAALLVPLLLALLLVLPRAFGLYLFPPGVPLIGAPVATVSVTVKSQAVTNSYLLMASPGVVQPDVTTRVLPDRALSVAVSGSRSTHTTGTQNIEGKQATGTILFDNSSRQSFTEQQGAQFTANNGVVVILSQPVTIPPRKDGGDGTVTATAMAATRGADGNIPTNTLYTTCCASLVIVSNPQPFAGGVDARAVHIVAQADLDGARKALGSSLQQQALQQLQGQLAAGEVEAGQPAITTQASSDRPVGAQADTVSVLVHLTATVTVYNAETARQLAEELVIRQAMQQLGNDYQLKDTLAVAAPVITSREKNGAIYLSISARGLWIYRLSQQQVDGWRQSIKGATPQLARTFIASQPGVAGVQIQLPFGADHLPSSLNQIQIVLVNV